MGELVDAIRGISDACRALAFPVVSGNVSLYNETNGAAIPPTPAIGGVGLLDDLSLMQTLAFKAPDECVLLVGAPDSWGSHLGQSVWLREVEGREEGPPPPVDLTQEKRAGDFVRGLIRQRLATAVHDVSDGGVAVALAEMAMASGIGVTTTEPKAQNPVATFFGEDQGRYLITVRRADLDRVHAAANSAGVSAATIGTTGGETLKLGGAGGISVASLKEAHESWFPAFMAGP